MEIGVDISHWDTVNYQILADNKVRFAFIKATQGDYTVDKMLTTHVNGCKTAGILCPVYHWCDPTRPVIAQTDYFLKAIEMLKVQGIALDVEQQWADWTEWSKGKITKVLSPNQISENARQIAERIKERVCIPIIYTSGYFTAEYTPKIAVWAKDYPLWLAHYPYRPTLLKTTWNEISTNWKEMQTWTNGVKRTPPLEAPRFPPGCTSWDFWQINDHWQPEGCDSAIDVDFFRGTYAELLALFHQAVSPSQPPLSDHENIINLLKEARSRGWRV